MPGIWRNRRAAGWGSSETRTRIRGFTQIREEEERRRAGISVRALLVNGVLTVCFSGASGTGKTTLIESIISSLHRKGYRVLAIKHTSHDMTPYFEFLRGEDGREFAERGAVDTRGKDTTKFLKAGARLSVLVWASGMAIFRGEGFVDVRIGLGGAGDETTLRRVVSAVTSSSWAKHDGDREVESRPDVVIVEGFKSVAGEVQIVEPEEEVGPDSTLAAIVEFMTAKKVDQEYFREE